MSHPLRVLYVFTARKRRLFERAARGDDPDTLLFGLNHLARFGVDAGFYEPEYGPLGRRAAHLAGRLGPDALQLRTLPAFTQYDAVFLTGGWPLLLAARAIQRARRPKLVWLNLTLTNLLRRGGTTAGLLRYAMRLADRIVCVAQYQREFLEREVGIPAARLPVALSGTDARFFDPARAAAAKAGGQGLVLAAGRDPARDYATLLAATRAAQIEAALVCSPRNLEGLDVPASARVRYDVTPSALRDEYAAAGVVAVPTAGDDSTHGSDCSGTLVLLDALAMGRPAVITQRASVPDYITAGEHALCVPPGDAAALRCALEQLLCDREYATRLASAGQERVRHELTTERFAGRLAEVFAEVAG